MKREKYKLLTS